MGSKWSTDTCLALQKGVARTLDRGSWVAPRLTIIHHKTYIQATNKKTVHQSCPMANKNSTKRKHSLLRLQRYNITQTELRVKSYGILKSQGPICKFQNIE